jgi:hypothetical protein
MAYSISLPFFTTIPRAVKHPVQLGPPLKPTAWVQVYSLRTFSGERK